MISIETRTQLVLALTLTTTVGLSGPANAASMNDDLAEAAPLAPSLGMTLEPTDSTPLYSLPWQLRPVTIGNAARIDSTAAAFNDANGNLDVAVASGLSVSYPITPEIAPMVRLAFVRNDAPGAALDGSSLANPLVGATYARSRGSWKLALFGGATLPIGTGGGDDRYVAAARTNVAALTAHPADDAMFAVNYLTELVGVDFAYVRHGFTAQAEATLLQYVRVRGESPSAIDRFRTNSVLGLHLGYFIGSHFSLGGDLRYQRWLSHPTTLDAATGAQVPLSGADLDAVTLAVGPRLHIGLGNQTSIHPGLSLLRGFDGRGLAAPLLTAQATAVQIDVPVTF